MYKINPHKNPPQKPRNSAINYQLYSKITISRQYMNAIFFKLTVVIFTKCQYSTNVKLNESRKTYLLGYIYATSELNLALIWVPSDPENNIRLFS